jgi:hypothetical protein
MRTPTLKTGDRWSLVGHNDEEDMFFFTNTLGSQSMVIMSPEAKERDGDECPADLRGVWDAAVYDAVVDTGYVRTVATGDNLKELMSNLRGYLDHYNQCFDKGVEVVQKVFACGFDMEDDEEIEKYLFGQDMTDMDVDEIQKTVIRKWLTDPISASVIHKTHQYSRDKLVSAVERFGIDQDEAKDLVSRFDEKKNRENEF